MTVTDLGNNVQIANSQTVVATVANSVPAGVLAVFCIDDGNTGFVGNQVFDSQGNSYLQVASNAATGGSDQSFIFAGVTTHGLTGGVDTFTYKAASGFGNARLGIFGTAFTGYTTPIDSAVTNTNNNGGAGTSFTITGNGPAAQAGELNFVLLSNSAAPSSTPSGWSTSPPTSWVSGVLQNAYYQINSGTSGLVFSGTMASGNWAAITIIAFPPPAAPPPATAGTAVGMASAVW